MIGHRLFDQIISIENLFDAWFDFSKGKRKRTDVQRFGLRLEENIFALHGDLVTGKWRHEVYQAFCVADPKPREIHKATVRDRVVHHAIVRAIESIFDQSFIYDSWSCRKGKGTHKSILRLHNNLEKLNRKYRGNVWVLKCDIRRFFSSIDHGILLDHIQQKISDKQTIELIRNIINSFTPGLPLGNLTSQLFANVYMNKFDHFAQEKLGAHRYMRYSDDFLLVHNNPDHLQLCLKRIDIYITEELNMQLHPHKIQLRRFDHGIDWLGYMLYPGYRIMRTSTKKRMRNRIEQTAFAYIDNNLSYDKLSSVLASYSGLMELSSSNHEKKYLTTLIASV